MRRPSRPFEALGDANQAANRAAQDLAVLSYVAELQFQFELRQDAAQTYRAILEAAPDNESFLQRLKGLGTTSTPTPETDSGNSK